MPAKRTTHGQSIFIEATAILTRLWLNWKLPAKPSLTTLRYLQQWVPSRGVRDAGTTRHEASSEQLSWTRATSIRSGPLEKITFCLSAIRKQNLGQLGQRPSPGPTMLVRN